MIARQIKNATLTCLMIAGLAGCGDGGVDEVRQWMAEVKSQTKVDIPKLSEPKRFTPFAYSGKTTVDPYSPSKLAVAMAKQAGGSSTGFKPDLERRREPLESYPLDALKMVGTLERPGLTYVLLQADKTVFQAKVGNYVGQNLGMITKITDSEVELKEIVQDAAGDWVERKAKLELQETKK
jgi:type IV pilus assembly protein PilP